MGLVLAYSSKVVTVTCYKCGVLFALEEAHYDKLVKNHRNFFCPNGHAQAFLGETEADKLKKELDRERQRREMAERTATAEGRRATRAENKLKRVGNGVCPCCNRSFTNLRQHMATKHPEHK